MSFVSNNGALLKNNFFDDINCLQIESAHGKIKLELCINKSKLNNYDIKNK